MPALTTRILREDWETSPRLVELQLEKSKLLTVRSTAVGGAADATPFHPANAAGTFSYQHGTFALRHEHVFAGSPWTVDGRTGSRLSGTSPTGPSSCSPTSISPAMTSISRNPGRARGREPSASALGTVCSATCRTMFRTFQSTMVGQSIT